MKKFSFRLEPLLRLRRLHEDEKKRRVGGLLSELNEHQQRAVEMAAAVTAQGALLKEQIAQGRVDLSWVAHYRTYVAHMQQVINARVHRIAETQQRLAGARRELAEAARQSRILDKLKELRRTRYDREIRRAQARERDEIGTNMFYRRTHSYR